MVWNVFPSLVKCLTICSQKRQVQCVPATAGLSYAPVLAALPPQWSDSGAVQVPSASQLLVPTPHGSASLQVHVPECSQGRYLSSSFLVEKLYCAQRDCSFFFSLFPLSLLLGEERGDRCSRELYLKKYNPCTFNDIVTANIFLPST